MLDYLFEVERKLHKLLAQPTAWTGKLVAYEKPMVERLWMQDGDNRIYLHRIHPCVPGEAYLHKHPWPAAMRIVKGQYEMDIGFETSAARMIMTPKSCYEMVDPEAMHAIYPMDDQCVLSLMVTGPLFDDIIKVSSHNPDLPVDMAKQLIIDFKKFYKGY